MTDSDDIDMLAAEYVLGTLEMPERTEVAARRQREPELDAAIQDWEQRLSPMLETVADVTPRADMFAEIKARIEKQSTDTLLPGQMAEVVELRLNLRRWRTVSIITSAVAACLAVFIFVSVPLAPAPDQQFVAVFQENDKQPQFVLSINLKTRELTIRPVAAKTRPGKSYQLWIASDQLGGTPRSLGVLGGADKPIRKALHEFDAKLLEAATFGISLEPEGGSPTGKPTSPAIHGKLILVTF